MLLLWLFVLFGNGVANVAIENILVAKRNLFLPTGIFAATLLLIIASMLFAKKSRVTIMIYIIIVGVTIFDLVRFGWKFIPFTDQKYLFPQTKVISFLQKQPGQFRIMTTDDRILPPNFSLIYRIQSVDVYDPLYLERYGELIAASERGEPNIVPPFGFNRIITPHRFDSKIIDLLGIKYVLSLSDINSPKLKKIFQEGETRIYENVNVFPRAFFVKDIYWAENKQDVIGQMFKIDTDLAKTAILEKPKSYDHDPQCPCSVGEVKIVSYSSNKIIMKTKNDNAGFLVLTDSYYPTWNVTIDGKNSILYKTDFNFRGVAIPAGNHDVKFKISLL